MKRDKSSDRENNEPEMTNKPNNKGNSGKNHKNRKWRIILGIVLLLALSAVLAYALLVRPPDIDPDGGLNSLPPVETKAEETPMVSEGPTTPEPTSGRKSYCFTFLLTGIDLMSGSSDTLMAGMLDTKNHKLNVVSVPRDTLANLGWDVKKINSCFTAGGIEETMKAMKQILGYSIDKYIVVDVEAFQKLVDSVGGVYFDVPVDMYHLDETQIIDVKQGYQLLNGEDALGVVRFRDYPMADIERIHVQQEFMKAAASQILKIENVTKVSEWAKIFNEYVETDLELGNLIWYGEQLLKLSDEDISFTSLPGEGVWIRGGSYININQTEWLAMINDNLNPYYDEIQLQHLDILNWDEQLKQATSTKGEIVSYAKFYKFPGSSY